MLRIKPHADSDGRAWVREVILATAAVGIFAGALALHPWLILEVAALALIFVPMEWIFALRSQRTLRPGWRTDVVHLVSNNILTAFLLAIAVVSAGSVLSTVVPEALRASVRGQPFALQAVEALLLAELGGYWGHRATHSVPILWKFHRVHHSATEMDWLAGGRVHPIDQAFTRSCMVLPLVALGFGEGALGLFVILATFQTLFIHANVRFRFGPLRWFVATPEFHHWHHSADPAAYNSNFAGEFPFMDVLFGTLHLPSGEMPDSYGISEPVPTGYLCQLAWPLRRDVDPGRPEPTALVVTPSAECSARANGPLTSSSESDGAPHVVEGQLGRHMTPALGTVMCMSP